MRSSLAQFRNSCRRVYGDSLTNEAVSAQFARQTSRALRLKETSMHDTVAGVRSGRVTVTSRWFYVWMAGACLITAIVGFAPTYWLQLSPGTFVGSPLVHLHAALFTAWLVFLLVQTTFAAT